MLAILRQFCAAHGHHFWIEDISIRDVIGPDTIITPAQITDVYLLGLAVQEGGKLATLDQHLPALAIEHGVESLELIIP